MRQACGPILLAALALASAGGAATPGAPHAECAQRARDSLKIVWSREGGATLERLLAEADTPEQKRFVQDVYRRPGAASTVQAAVEADCIAEKQRPEQARRESPAPAAPAAPPAAPAAPSVASKEKLDPRRHCAHYNAELARLRDLERTGGNATVMETYAVTRRELRARMFADGC